MVTGRHGGPCGVVRDGGPGVPFVRRAPTRAPLLTSPSEPRHQYAALRLPPAASPRTKGGLSGPRSPCTDIHTAAPGLPRQRYRTSRSWPRLQNVLHCLTCSQPLQDTLHRDPSATDHRLVHRYSRIGPDAVAHGAPGSIQVGPHLQMKALPPELVKQNRAGNQAAAPVIRLPTTESTGPPMPPLPPPLPPPDGIVPRRRGGVRR